MVFANVVRLIRQSERILHTKRIGWTICDYPRVLISNDSNTVEMSKPKILITRPDIPVAGLNLLRKRWDLHFKYLNYCHFFYLCVVSLLIWHIYLISLYYVILCQLNLMSCQRQICNKFNNINTYFIYNTCL